METQFPVITIWQLIPMIWGGISPGILQKLPDKWSDTQRIIATILWHAVTAFVFVLSSGNPTITNWAWFAGQTFVYTILSYMGLWNKTQVQDNNENANGRFNLPSNTQKLSSPMAMRKK